MEHVTFLLLYHTYCPSAETEDFPDVGSVPYLHLKTQSQVQLSHPVWDEKQERQALGENISVQAL